MTGNFVLTEYRCCDGINRGQGMQETG